MMCVGVSVGVFHDMGVDLHVGVCLGNFSPVGSQCVYECRGWVCYYWWGPSVCMYVEDGCVTTGGVPVCV